VERSHNGLRLAGEETALSSCGCFPKREPGIRLVETAFCGELRCGLPQNEGVFEGAEKFFFMAIGDRVTECLA
jgi:hypothetical protein